MAAGIGCKRHEERGVKCALQAGIGSHLGQIVLAIGTLEVLRNVAMPKLQDALTWLPIDLSAGTFAMFYVMLAVFGLVIGLIGSAFAMRRYLKV